MPTKADSMPTHMGLGTLKGLATDDRKNLQDNGNHG